jgi:hypothetical protein
VLAANSSKLLGAVLVRMTYLRNSIESWPKVASVPPFSAPMIFKGGGGGVGITVEEPPRAEEVGSTGTFPCGMEAGSCLLQAVNAASSKARKKPRVISFMYLKPT